jgi:putative glutamine amidotransferase
MKPVIAISSVPRDVPTGYGGDRADTVAAGVVAGVIAAGGVPLLLPVVAPDLAGEQIAAVDGLLLAGGQDLDLPETDLGGPRWIDPARDAHEFALWREAQRRELPVLGVCRGLQLVNVALGGTLEPHVDGHDAGDEHATRLHPVIAVEGSRLAELFPERTSAVNTIHHQTVRELGRGLVASGHAEDGTVEAAEFDAGGQWFVGVQWHPELILDRPSGQPLFDGLVAAARGARAARTEAPVRDHAAAPER